MVQGEVEGKYESTTVDGIQVYVDDEILRMYSEPMKLDYVENQGFRLLTSSQYLATHLSLRKSVAEI